MSDDVNRDELGNVDDLEQIEALLAELDVDDLEPVAPPKDVWAGIDRRVKESERAPAPSAPVHPIAEGRRRRTVTWVLAAAAAIVLILAVTVAVTGRGTTDEVVSVAALTYDPAAFDPRGADASAEAQLLARDGAYSIRLTDTNLPELDADDLELWLIEPDDAGKPVDVAPVSLVDPDDDGTYDVPAGLDPVTHYVVDISIEPRDGDATHSGQSILRGALRPV
jgi:anti-sigma-K factor RskA